MPFTIKILNCDGCPARNVNVTLEFTDPDRALVQFPIHITDSKGSVVFDSNGSGGEVRVYLNEKRKTTCKLTNNGEITITK